MILLRELQDSHVVGIKFDRYGAYHALTTCMNDSEVAAEFVNWVDSFPQIFDRHFLCVFVGTNLPQKMKTLRLLEKSSVFLAKGDADIDDLDLF